MLTWVIIHVVSLGFTLGYSWVKCWTWTGQAVGVYLETPSFTEIYVCDIWDGNTEATKQHELWHFVYDKRLTDKQKKEYKKLWEKHKKNWLKAFNRDYGMVSVEEGFAEDYARIGMKNNRYINQRIRLIKSFL